MQEESAKRISSLGSSTMDLSEKGVMKLEAIIKKWFINKTIDKVA